MTTRARYRDTSEYIQFMRRIVRGAGERVGTADADELRELIALEGELDEAITVAVTGLRDSGATWDDIGKAAGTSRQAAHQRWAHRLPRAASAQPAL